MNRLRQVGGKTINAIIVAVLAIYLAGIQTPAQAPEDFPVPANMKVEGIPAIKNNEVERLFFDPSQIRANLLWDVDRKNRSLLVTDEKSQIYLVRSPLLPPERLTDDRVPYTVRVNPKGSSFAFTDDKADRDNYELYYWSPLEGGKGSIRKLSTFTGKDEPVESILWNRDGSAIYYAQIDYDAKTTKICRHDLSAATCALTGLKGIWNVLDSAGDKLLLKSWKASSQQSLYLYDLVTQKLTPIEEEGNATKGFFAAGRVFWIAGGSKTCASESCVSSIDLKTGARKSISIPQSAGTLQDLKPSPNGKNFLIQETRNGMDNLRIGRLAKDAIVGRAGSFIQGSYVVWNTRWLSDHEIIYSTENISKPASLQSFDVDSGKTISWTKEKLPPQLDGKATEPEPIAWRAFDDREISGYVVKPRTGNGKHPVLVYIHGGPQTIDKPVFNTSDLRLIANLGIAIIHTNVRGSSGFGSAFMDADNGAKRGDAARDIRSLLDWIAKQGDLDAQRIYIRGESYGGFVALSAAMQEPQRIKAVIAEYPIVSVRGYLSQSWIDEFAKAEYGDPKDEKLMSELDKLSPLNNAPQWSGAPLFLTRGKLDSRVPEKDVLDLKTQLQARGTDVWFIYATEAGHGVGGRYVTAAMYEFLKKQIENNKEK
jgi:dipeptidyl aminopeptidase/acylaminoacyl peptidase